MTACLLTAVLLAGACAPVDQTGASPSARGSFGQEAAPPQERTAPDFEATGSDDKTHTLASLSTDKPLVLLFIKDGCGLTRSSFPFFNRIGAAYGKDEKVSYVGVINNDKTLFPYWSKRFKPEFTFLLDPDKKIIHAFGVQQSNHVVLVDKGKIVAEHKAFSRSSLEGIAKFLAAASPKDQALDFADAPEKESYG